MISRSAKPILDNEISHFLKNLDASMLFSEEKISPVGEQRQSFLKEFETWADSRLTKAREALSQWNPLVTDGTTGAFVDFQLAFPERPLYVLRGEYPFHKNTGAHVVDNFEKLPSGSKLILSDPFSATGNRHPQIFELLEYCSRSNIKVLIDSALLFISNQSLFDLRKYECVSACAFSLSKSFCTGRFRIGVCYTRLPWKSSPSYLLNEWSYLNHLSMLIHQGLMKHFDVEFIINKYTQTQKKICKKLELKVSDTVIFGISDDEKYREYSRAGVTNRLCLSDLMRSDL